LLHPSMFDAHRPAFRWRVSIYILAFQLVLSNVQTVVFFIGFRRAFASIKRKMMMNILMQVFLYPQPFLFAIVSCNCIQDMGFFEERDSASLVGRLTNQVLQFAWHLCVSIPFIVARWRS
jgi:predicted neutral ceramidase superfamily lipid hydrolase